MCRIKGCSTPPVARGLCSKHYMRQRRTGNPDTIGKAGRPKDADLAAVRATVAQWLPLASKRTRERFLAAYQSLLDEEDIPNELIVEIINRATRPNGSTNVAEFEREAVAAIAIFGSDES